MRHGSALYPFVLAYKFTLKIDFDFTRSALRYPVWGDAAVTDACRINQFDI